MSITRNNSIWYKFLAVLLVVALLFTFVLPRPQAKAVALVDDALLLSGAAVAVMIAAGIYFTSQNTDADSFGSFISGKIDNFISSEGTGSVSEYASGISLNPNGVGLNVTDPTMRFLDRFLNWFKSEENLSSVESSVGSFYYLDGYCLSTDYTHPQVLFTYDMGSLTLPLGSYDTLSFSTYTTYEYQSCRMTSTLISAIPSNYYTSNYSKIGIYASNSSSKISIGFCLYGPKNLSDLSGEWHWVPSSNYDSFDQATHLSSSDLSSLSASYSANPSYSVSDTQTGTLPFIIVIDETAAGGSGGNNNKHDTARDAAISALQLGLAGKLLSSVTQSSSDPGQEGGDSNVSSDVSGIRAAVNSIKNWLDTGFKTFSEVCTQFFTDVRLFFADFWTNFTTKLKEVFNTSLEAIKELLSNIKAGISSAAESIKSAVSTAADTIGGKIDSIGTKISDWWEEWRSSKNDKPSSFFGAGFNSIWHYVVEWLSYIGGFLSLVLNVWSVLPYGMVVPVYAAVVLVLYFGIYRKFIK